MPQESRLLQLIYVSSATKPFDGNELQALLTQARVRNQGLGITGLLVYLNGNFLQIIEGEREVVLSLAKHIEADPRHNGMLTLLQRPLEKRSFGDWSMGYKGPADLTPDERQAFNTLVESMTVPGRQLAQDKVARVVVSTFISNNR